MKKLFLIAVMTISSSLYASSTVNCYISESYGHDTYRFDFKARTLSFDLEKDSLDFSEDLVDGEKQNAARFSLESSAGKLEITLDHIALNKAGKFKKMLSRVTSSLDIDLLMSLDDRFLMDIKQSGFIVSCYKGLIPANISTNFEL